MAFDSSGFSLKLRLPRADAMFLIVSMKEHVVERQADVERSGNVSDPNRGYSSLQPHDHV
jgi:hypothetical protein